MPPRLAGQRLDEAGLARAGGPVEQQPELVRVAREGVLILLTLEVLKDVEKVLLLREEHGVEVLEVAEFVALIPERSQRRRRGGRRRRRLNDWLVDVNQ